MRDNCIRHFLSTMLEVTRLARRTVFCTDMTQFMLHDRDCIISIIVNLTQCCSRDFEDGLQGADGWQPKSLATAFGRGNQPAEDYRSPTAVARASHNDREIDTNVLTEAVMMFAAADS